MLEQLKSDAVVSKFVTHRECLSYRQAIDDMLGMLRAVPLCGGPEDEAVALLIELHKFLDFEVPLQPGDMEIESPEGINEVFAKAYALINSRDATPQHTKEDV
jgi:hypothetical protein